VCGWEREGSFFVFFIVFLKNREGGRVKEAFHCSLMMCGRVNLKTNDVW